MSKIKDYFGGEKDERIRHYKNRSTSDFILFLFGSFITYLLVLGVFNWLLNKYNQHRRDKIDMEMEDSE